MDRETDVRQRFEALRGEFNERTRRLFAAAEARAIGHGGIALVSRATGIGRVTIRRGLRELAQPSASSTGRVRKAGGGRKRATELDPKLMSELERLVEPASRGDPERTLRWTLKSVRRLAEELCASGHKTNRQNVSEMQIGRASCRERVCYAV